LSPSFQTVRFLSQAIFSQTEGMRRIMLMRGVSERAFIIWRQPQCSGNAGECVCARQA
jgi:hypothetical protein